MRVNVCTLIFVLLLSCTVFAKEEIIAHGESPQGKSYFAYTRLVSKKDSGWQDNGIKKGIFEVVMEEGSLDIRYVDAAKRSMSSRADGGQVTLLNKAENEVAVLVYYPGNGIEVYTFYIDKDGKKRFTLTQARGGANVPATQSSIFTGSCDYIYFDRFPE